MRREKMVSKGKVWSPGKKVRKLETRRGTLKGKREHREGDWRLDEGGQRGKGGETEEHKAQSPAPLHQTEMESNRNIVISKSRRDGLPRHKRRKPADVAFSRTRGKPVKNRERSVEGKTISAGKRG